MSGRKIGSGSLQAMGRLGLKELRNAMNPSRESVADSEIGLYGTQTQGEIAAARGGPGEGPEQESKDSKLTLDQMRGEARQKGKDDDQGREQGREQERDRDLER